MNGGKLRHRITIQVGTRTTSNEGETSRSWASYAQRWAAWKQENGNEIENDAESVEGRAVHTFTIRNTDGITTDMRVSYLSRVFNITSIVADATDERWQKIRCTEITAEQ